MTAIADCPPLEADDGTGRRLVTAVFRHVADNVINVSIDGEPEPIGCTSNHPFWSHDRQEFVEAGGLKLGEQVLSDDGTPRAITRITPHRGPPVVVYNFEVDVEHVYVVGDNGLLVHNSCGTWVDDPNGTDISRRFQGQVTGREGEAYRVNGVDFDGYKRGDLLEAKGLGYKNLLNGRRGESVAANVQNKLLAQAQRQVAAASRSGKWNRQADCLGLC